VHTTPPGVFDGSLQVAFAAQGVEVAQGFVLRTHCPLTFT
jgi:hypothetical protein